MCEKRHIEVPNRDNMMNMIEMNMPPADHSISVLLAVLSISKSATYVANTLMNPTMVLPSKGSEMTPVKNSVE